MPELLRSMGVARLGAMAGITAAMFGFFAYIMTGMSGQPMSLLYAGLDNKDSAAIIRELETAKVPYKIEGDGGTIMVASDRALRLRMELAGKGLPGGGSVGYEIFDSMEAFGQTSFVQNVNMTRALEGELSRTIRALSVIDQARVHLVMPKRELFSGKDPQPSASVVLRSRGGRIKPDQVQAIQHLVASAVNGLLPESVTIIDEKGLLLADGKDNGGTGRVDDRVSSYQDNLRQRVEDILTRIVGSGRARVQVTAEMDFAKTTRSSETFDPNGQVVRSTQSVNQKQQDQNKKGDAAVSVTTSLPTGAQNAATPPGGAQSVSSTDNVEETVNYEISKTMETLVEETGRVKRLSIAVVLDGTYTTDAAGARTYAPRNPDEMKEIEQLVRSAIGFDEKRGDQVKVVNLRFSEPEAEALPPVEEPFMGMEKGDIWRIAQFGGIGLLALVVIFTVLRPLVRALTMPSAAHAPSGMQALPSAQQAGAALPAPQAQGQVHLTQNQMAALSAPTASQHVSSMIDISQVEGQVKESSVRKVGEIIHKHPDEAVAIMRQWLHESA